MRKLQQVMNKVKNTLRWISHRPVVRKAGLDKVNLMSSMVSVAYLTAKAEKGICDDALLKPLSDAGWQRLTSSFEHDLTHQYGYKAVVFINHQSNEIHIAHAGTQLTDKYDLWDDAKLLFNAIPSKLEPAQHLVNSIIRLIGGVDQAQTYTFSTSGHSLGAILSDLMAAELLSRGLPFQQSATFENPGSLAIVKKALKKQCLSGEVSLSQVQACCQEYNAKRNFINTCKQRLGRRIHLVVFQPQPSSGLFLPGTCSFIYELLLEGIITGVQQHKMDNFSHLTENNTFIVDTKQWCKRNVALQCVDLPGTRLEDRCWVEALPEENGWVNYHPPALPGLAAVLSTFPRKQNPRLQVAEEHNKTLHYQSRAGACPPILTSRSC